MRIKKLKIFLTGGAGFIGSHIADSLLKKGAELTIYDNFSSGTIDNIKSFKKDLRIIRGDIRDINKLRRSMKGHDLVSHQAAQLEIFRSTDDPYYDLEVNTIGTLNVIRAAKDNEVKKIINASSACVYGQKDGATDESDPTEPNWAYGVSKLAAEKYCSISSNYNDIPVTSLRYGITYGEREWYRRVLTIFIKRAIRKQPLVVFGQGDQIRDFVYVGDVVDLHNRCIENDEVAGKIYNAGSGVGSSIYDLARTVIKVSKNNLEIIKEKTEEGEYSKLIPDKKRNTAELKLMLLDIKKAKKELGWEPKVKLSEGIKKEFDWASNNLKRWDKIIYSTK